MNIEGKTQWAPWYIKAVRQRLGISRKDLAKMLNVEYLTLARWETGVHCAKGLAKRNLDKFLLSPKVKKLDIKPEECGICIGGFMEDEA